MTIRHRALIHPGNVNSWVKFRLVLKNLSTNDSHDKISTFNFFPLSKVKVRRSVKYNAKSATCIKFLFSHSQTRLQLMLVQATVGELLLAAVAVKGSKGKMQ